ncbi:MAG: arsenosugar biosynthesis radical SAM (seleno)protein ArsS [Acidobacteriota bacterium]
MRSFDLALRDAALYPLRATGIEVLQINVGKRCNLACGHCHVGAGPDRSEIMSSATAASCMRLLERVPIPAIDITGGAPEMNPSFCGLVEHARALGRRVTVRSNLAVMLAPEHADLAEFLAAHDVEIIASLPSFVSGPTDAQRGAGVFDQAIEVVRRLNALGYGALDGFRRLHFAFNPSGDCLPPAQRCLESDFKRELGHRYGIVFNSLFAIVNMPIGRFRASLEARGRYHAYMQKLIDAHNPATACSLMCRTTVSVAWDGTLYDCDFNQMLDLPINHGAPDHIDAFDAHRLETRHIVTGLHCYGCTAGAGSSCGGAIS